MSPVAEAQGRETVLPNLTAEDLKEELGVASLGHRRKLLDAIAALRTDESCKVPSAHVATASNAPSASMAASDASSDRYDPWYVKVAFGLFLSALVGFPAVLYGLPHMIVAR